MNKHKYWFTSRLLEGRQYVDKITPVSNSRGFLHSWRLYFSPKICDMNDYRLWLWLLRQYASVMKCVLGNNLRITIQIMSSKGSAYNKMWYTLCFYFFIFRQLQKDEGVIIKWRRRKREKGYKKVININSSVCESGQRKISEAREGVGWGRYCTYIQSIHSIVVTVYSCYLICSNSSEALVFCVSLELCR